MVHGILQILDHRIEIGVGQMQTFMRRRHIVPLIIARAVRDLTKLDFELGAQAIDVGFVEYRLDPVVGEIIVHGRIDNLVDAFLAAHVGKQVSSAKAGTAVSRIAVMQMERRAVFI